MITIFEHDPSVINFAWTLVKEYNEHEKEQDRLWKEKHGTKESVEPLDRE